MNFRWMNGQHLRSLPSEELNQIIGERWKDADIVTESQGVFVQVEIFPSLSFLNHIVTTRFFLIIFVEI